MKAKQPEEADTPTPKFPCSIFRPAAVAFDVRRPRSPWRFRTATRSADVGRDHINMFAITLSIVALRVAASLCIALLCVVYYDDLRRSIFPCAKLSRQCYAFRRTNAGLCIAFNSIQLVYSIIMRTYISYYVIAIMLQLTIDNINTINTKSM